MEEVEREVEAREGAAKATATPMPFWYDRDPADEEEAANAINHWFDENRRIRYF